MILFFDLCDYTNPTSPTTGGVIGCGNIDYRLYGDWSDLDTIANNTKDAFITAMNQLVLALGSQEPGVSGCTGYTTALETITGMSTDSRYVSFWDLANNQMGGITPQIYDDYTQLINEVMCAANEVMYYFSGQEITTHWSYPEEWKKDYWGIDCCPLPKCGDDCIDLSGKLTTDLVEVDSVEEFTNIIYSELIDVKNRQTISAYPTLKLLYERYNYNSLDFSNYQSSQYDYFDMDNFGLNVNNYWVDLIEQVVPATTIWESTYEYRNTVFDTQKYKYRHNNIYWGRDPSANFPFSAVSSDISVSVILEQLPNPTGNTSNDTINDTSNSDNVPINPIPPSSGDLNNEDTGVPITTDPTLDNDSAARKRLMEEKSKFESALENDTQYTKPLFNNTVGVWEMQHTCSPEFLGTVIVGRGNKEESGSGGAIIGGDTRPSVIP